MAAPSRLLILVPLLAGVLALSGCGVKGALEPPPGGVQAREAAAADAAGKKVDTSAPLRPDRKLWIDNLL